MAVNLQKSYSAMNEKLVKLFDEAGVRRAFTVPYIDGQTMDDHVTAVGQAASQSGGLTNNLIMSYHHSDGKGWGSGDGHTVGHQSDKLRHTIIPKDDKNAKAVIDAAQNHISNLKHLLGDEDSTVRAAQGQLDLVKATDGAGMNLLDFGVMMTQIMWAPTQAAARAHSGTKEGGHAPHLRAPNDTSQPGGVETAQETPGQDQAPGSQQAASAAPAAPAGPGAPSVAAPAAPAGPAMAQQV